ncbi:MAG: hypothetical protein OXG11_12690 [Chloroflexi bacterium]|nr:hypothetical protein [Chloroflexota bacterium]
MAIVRVAKPPIDPRIMLEEMRREEQDSQWIVDNMPALVKKHGIKFIAVSYKTVIGESSRLTDLLKDLEAKGVSPASVTIDVLSPHN